MPGLPPPLHLLLAVLVGFAAGAMYAGIAAGLWAWRGVNEIVSTLLMNLHCGADAELVRARALKAEGVRTNRSERIPDSAQWPNLVDESPLNFDLFLMLALVVAVAWMLRRTTFGMRLRLTGANVEAARGAGVRTVWIGDDVAHGVRRPQRDRGRRAGIGRRRQRS